jgi:hypothetical protein
VVTGEPGYRIAENHIDRTPTDERKTAMKYRTLGRTGIKVIPYCLGAMMFGGIANSDHDDCIRSPQSAN